MMKVSIYNTEVSRTLEEFDTQESQTFIELIQKYGYTDEDGVEYVYIKASVEFPHIVCIYIKPQ